MDKTVTLITTVIVISFLTITSCGNETEHYDTILTEINEVGEVNKTTAKLEIKGMMCEVGCVSKIKKELLEKKGVLNVTIDYDSDREMDFATVEYDPEIETSESLILAVTTIADGKLYGVPSVVVTNYAPNSLN